MDPYDKYPEWTVLHIPHDSTLIPDSTAEQFLLGDPEMGAELLNMTDRHTYDIFNDPESSASVVRAPVSRVVVDVERFTDDNQEPMAERGMGCVYTRTSTLAPLRRTLRAEERQELLEQYYHPHHAALEEAVTGCLERYGKCVVLDCHSFASLALPYEMKDPDIERPEICIGTDAFHTSETLRDDFYREFQHIGYQVKVDDPFAGALVPTSHCRKDKRVSAVMVEINRSLYMTENDGKKITGFDTLALQLRQCCARALHGSLNG